MPEKPVKHTVKESYTDDFAGRLRSLRAEAGLTQPAMARALGISTSYINLLETGARSNPTIELIDGVCTFFGVRREWLLDGAQPKFMVEPPQVARDRFYAVLRQKLGMEAEREIREQQVIAEISVRLAQVPWASESMWAEYRRDIMRVIDSYAEHMRKDTSLIRVEGLKLARAVSDETDRSDR